MAAEVEMAPSGGGLEFGAPLCNPSMAPSEDPVPSSTEDEEERPTNEMVPYVAAARERTPPPVSPPTPPPPPPPPPPPLPPPPNSTDVSQNSNSGLTPLLIDQRSLKPFKSSEEYLEAMKEDLAEWLNGMYPDLSITANEFMEKLDTGVVLCKHANNVREAAEEWVARRQARRMQLSGGMSNSTAVTNGGGLNGGRIGGVAYRADVKPGTFFARDNVSNFIAWCRHQLGVLECLLFETDDLILRKNTRHVVLCLLEVARRGARFGMPAPLLVQFEREIEREIAAETRTMLKRRGSSRRRLVLHPGEEADCEEEEDEEEEEDDDEDYPVMCGPMPQIVTNDLKSLDEMVRELVERCSCPTQFPMVRVSEGKYRIGDTKVLIFVRILRKHVMVRVGGGWDTLSHYLDKHDPCRCRTAHRSALSSRLILRNTPAIELGSAVVHYDRSPASPPRTRRSSTSSVGSGVGGTTGVGGLSPSVGTPGSGRRSLAGPEAERGRDEGRDVRSKRSRSRSPYHLHASGTPQSNPQAVVDSRRSPARRSPARHIQPQQQHPIIEKQDSTSLRITSVAPTTVQPTVTTQAASCDSSGDEGYRSLQGPRRSGEEEEEEDVLSKEARNAAEETDGRPDSRLAAASSSDCSSTLSADDSTTQRTITAAPTPIPAAKRSPAVEKRTVRHSDIVSTHHPENSPRRVHRPNPTVTTPSAAPRSPATIMRMTRSRSAGGDTGLAAAERHVMGHRSIRLRAAERMEDETDGKGKNTWSGRTGPRARPALTADTFRRPGAGSSSPPTASPRRSLPASLACGSQSAPPRRRAWNSGQQQSQNYPATRGTFQMGDHRRHKGSLPASLQPSPTRAPEVAPILEQMLRETTAEGEEDTKVLRQMRELIRRYAAIVEGKLAEGEGGGGGPTVHEGAPVRGLTPSPRKDSKPGSRIPAPTFYGAPCS